MKKLYNIIIGITIIMGFTQCGTSQKKLTENPPFTLNEVRNEPWTSGANNKQKGENIYITFALSNDIKPDSLYYNGQAAKLEKIQRGSYVVYIGRFENKAPQDIILHADPQKEFGNKPPQLKTKMPFELKEGEAILSYSEEGKTNYYKIQKMKPATAIHYKDTPPTKN